MCDRHYQSNKYRQLEVHSDHDYYLKRTIQLAYDAKLAGNGGFGAILVNELGEIVLETKNEVKTADDCTAHAELLLVREASKRYNQSELEKMRLYCNCEPCVMCMGAIIWAKIGHVIFGTTEREMLDMAHAKVSLHIPSTTLVEASTFKPTMIGPFEHLDELARIVFK